MVRCCSFSNGRVRTQELVDYFFYALLRTQGEDTTEERSTASVVPVAEVPNIMRALGYYPTEQVGFGIVLLTNVGRRIEVVGAGSRWFTFCFFDERKPVSRIFVLCMGEGTLTFPVMYCLEHFASMGKR